MKDALIPMAIPAVLFILGLFRRSKAYNATRDTLGVACFNLGKAVSGVGNTRLKGLWEPIEAVAVDFLLWAPEQIAAGLRSDNPEKLKAHVKRLRGVGSKSRLAAVKVAIVKAEAKVEKAEARAADKAEGAAP